MRVEPYVSGMETNFVVVAENATDRALLTAFCRSDRHRTHKFVFHGNVYSCDHSATTSFNFGWVDKSKIAERDLPYGWRRFLRAYRRAMGFERYPTQG